MGTGELTCQRDGVATQLTCAGCAAPICPACLVRTPVGLKCPACVGPVATRGRMRLPVPVLAALAVVVLAVAGWLAVGRSGSGSSVAAAKAGLDIANTASESRIGQEVRDGTFAFTVTRVDYVGQEVGTPPSTRVAQGRFCLLHLHLRNVGNQPAAYSGAAQLLADTSAQALQPRRGRRRGGVSAPGHRRGDKEITDVRLNPGAEVDGVLIFDMPVAAKPAEFEFHAAPRTIGVKVRLDTLSS